MATRKLTRATGRPKRGYLPLGPLSTYRKIGSKAYVGYRQQSPAEQLAMAALRPLITNDQLAQLTAQQRTLLGLPDPEGEPE